MTMIFGETFQNVLFGATATIKPFIKNQKELTVNQDGTGTAQLFHIGTWEHAKYGIIEFTPQTMADFIKNYKENVRGQQLYFDIGHSGDGMGAAGWFTDLFMEGDWLCGTIKYTPQGAKRISDGDYKYASAEWQSTYTDPLTKAATEYHFGKNGELIQKAGDDGEPNIEALSAKLDMVHNEILQACKGRKGIRGFNALQGHAKKILAIIVEHMPVPEKLTEERSNNMSEVIEKDVKILTEKLTASEDAAKKLTEQVKSLSEAMTLKEHENKLLTEQVKTQGEAVVKMQGEIRHDKFSRRLSEYLPKPGKSEFTLKLDQIPEQLAFVEGLSDEMAEKYFKSLDTMPKIKVLGEIGSDGDISDPDAPADPRVKLNEDAKKLSEQNKIPFEEALKKLAAERKM